MHACALGMLETDPRIEPMTESQLRALSTRSRTGGAAPSAQSIGGMSAMVGKGARQGLIAGEISCLLVIGLTTFEKR